MFRYSFLSFILLFSAIQVQAAGTQGAIYTVDTDYGACNAPVGTSLCDAIEFANNNPGADTIQFNLPPATTIILSQTNMYVDGDLLIDGSGTSGLVISTGLITGATIFRIDHTLPVQLMINDLDLAVGPMSLSTVDQAVIDVQTIGSASVILENVSIQNAAANLVNDELSVSAIYMLNTSESNNSNTFELSLKNVSITGFKSETKGVVHLENQWGEPGSTDSVVLDTVSLLNNNALSILYVNSGISADLQINDSLFSNNLMTQGAAAQINVGIENSFNISKTDFVKNNNSALYEAGAGLSVIATRGGVSSPIFSIMDSVFNDNTAENKAALNLEVSDVDLVSLKNLTVNNNEAIYENAAVSLELTDASLIIDQLEIVNNISAYSVAGLDIDLFSTIDTYQGQVVIDGLQAFNNIVSNEGEGHVVISDNWMNFNGGAHQIHVLNSTVASSDKAGLVVNSYLDSDAPTTTKVTDLYLANSTISGNQGGQGGGVSVFSGFTEQSTDPLNDVNQVNAYFINNTIVDNNASTAGGLWLEGENHSQTSKGSTIYAYIYNTVISDNTASSSPNLHISDGAHIEELKRSLIGNIETGDFGKISTDELSDFAPSVDMISFMQIDPVLSGLQDNGAGIFTHKPLHGSPLIDAGDATALSILTTAGVSAAASLDQRGENRVIYTEVDIGAVEFNAPIFTGLAPPPSMYIDEDSSGSITYQVEDDKLAGDQLSCFLESGDQALLANTACSIATDGSLNLSVTPFSNQNGYTQLSVKVSDNENAEASVETFFLNVASVNDAPVILDVDAGFGLNQLVLNEDESEADIFTLSIQDEDFLAAQGGEYLDVSVATDNPLFVAGFSIEDGVANTYEMTAGDGSSTADMNFSYVLADNQSGEAVWTFTATDMYYAESTRVVNVSVLPVDDPASFIDFPGPMNISEGASPQVVQVNFADDDLLDNNPTLATSSIAVAGDSGHFSNVSITNGAASANQYVADLSFSLIDDDVFGSAFIDLVFTDPLGNEFAHTFSFAIDPVNDAPVLAALLNLEVVSTGSIGVEIPISASDVESDLSALRLSSVASTNTTLVPLANIQLINGGTTLEIVPTDSEFGASEISLAVKDEEGVESSVRTFTLTVLDGQVYFNNDQMGPFSLPDVLEDSGPHSVTLNIVDNNLLNVAGATQAAALSVSAYSGAVINVQTSSLSIVGNIATSNISFDLRENNVSTGEIHLDYVDTQGAVTTRVFNITTLPVNDAPVLSQITDQTSFNAAPVVVSLALIDVDSSFEDLVLSQAHLSSSDEAILPKANIDFDSYDKTLTLTPIPGSNGEVTVNLAIADGFLPSVVQEFTLNVVDNGFSVLSVDPITVDSSAGEQRVRFYIQLNDPASLISDFTFELESDNSGALTDIVVDSGFKASEFIIVTGRYSPSELVFGDSVLTFTATNAAVSLTESFTVTVVEDVSGGLDGIASEAENADDEGEATTGLGSVSYFFLILLGLAGLRRRQ